MTKFEATDLIKLKTISGFKLYLIYEKVQNTYNVLLRNNVEEKIYVFDNLIIAVTIFDFLKMQSSYVLAVMIQE